MEPPVGSSGRGEPIPQPHGGALRPLLPGVSGNPSGRAKVARPVSSAYAELLDTPGDTLKAQLEEFKRRRGDKFCAADMVAVGMLTSAVNPSNKGQTSAASEITDRTEGKVEQPHAVRAQETDALIRHLADATGIDPESIRALGAQLGGQG